MNKGSQFHRRGCKRPKINRYARSTHKRFRKWII